MPRPASYPDFATNTNYATGPDTGEPTKEALATADVEDGNIRGAGNAPSPTKFNWWMNLVGLWTRQFVDELDDLTTDVAAAQTTANTAVTNAADAAALPQCISWRCGGPNTANTTCFFAPWYSATGIAITTENQAQLIWGAGTFKNLRVKFLSVGADADTCTVTMRINGVDTALTVTVPGNSTTMVSDTTHTVAVANGDLVSVKAVTAGITGNTGFCVMWDFVPTN